MFTLDEGKRLAEAEHMNLRYDVQADAFLWAAEGVELETYKAEQVKCADGVERKLYPIGTGDWCWEQG
jgi:hypothetical protein